jgi:biotin-dependent carboxylase-like uncharacterized protein
VTPGTGTVEVLRPGPFATIQDLGRTGYAAVGVPLSGAADLRSFALANALVGNPPKAAAIEATFGGLEVRAHSAVVIAVTGAPCLVTIDGSAASFGAAVSVDAGAVVQVGSPRRGLRTYLAVRGGIDVPAVLGSRSTDVLAGIGPPALGRGSILPLGDMTDGAVDPPIVHPVPAELAVHVQPGPRRDWFADNAIELLCASTWTVLMESNRVALRLHGPVLPRRRDDELPPEGLVRGAIQVPPDGNPVLFLADHPVTGGYPVLAVVHEEDQWLAAQARPGRPISFRAQA